MSGDIRLNAFGDEQLTDDPDVNVMFEVSWEVANKGERMGCGRH